MLSGNSVCPRVRSAGNFVSRLFSTGNLKKDMPSLQKILRDRKFPLRARKLSRALWTDDLSDGGIVWRVAGGKDSRQLAVGSKLKAKRRQQEGDPFLLPTANC
jgi:hypothetical protein